jgi:hypothetical protein
MDGLGMGKVVPSLLPEAETVCAMHDLNGCLTRDLAKYQTRPVAMNVKYVTLVLTNAIPMPKCL